MGGTCHTLSGNAGRTVVIIKDMSYQETTGTLSPGAHAGSYNGQDAYNDMLVVDDGVFNSENRPVQEIQSSPHIECKGLQRRNRFDIRGGEQVNEPVYMSDRKGHSGITENGTATTLTAQEKERPIVGTSVVRRLTPLECERLQGFPDDWSKYGDFDGEVKELSDAARYRLQGNSIARPFWTWLMRRIAAQYERPATLGSLFDGQSGFILCGLEVGMKPVWSSEIEKNAVAVAKYHFPEEDV